MRTKRLRDAESEWLKTYRAVLQGLYSNSGVDLTSWDDAAKLLHEMAVKAATLAHGTGPLKPTVKGPSLPVVSPYKGLTTEQLWELALESAESGGRRAAALTELGTRPPEEAAGYLPDLLTMVKGSSCALAVAAAQAIHVWFGEYTDAKRAFKAILENPKSFQLLKQVILDLPTPETEPDQAS